VTIIPSWAKLPWELRERAQWCLAAPPGLISPKGKEPLTLSGPSHLYIPKAGFYLAKANEPSTWLSFEQAASEAWKRGWHIGYVLSQDDPFACIDFDIKDPENAPDKPEIWTTREQYEYYLSCIHRFDSYTEQSASGKGFHVWVRGKIGPGARAGGIEVYSQERFMISTGAITKDRPIQPQQPALIQFIESIRPKKYEEAILEEIPPEYDNWYILETALNASNSEKFLPLWEGKWQELGYPSQSEADLALLSMLTFYSQSDSQVRELFRESKLGKREKARKNDDYLNRTLRVIRSREKNENLTDISSVIEFAKVSAQLKQEEQDRLAQQEINRLQAINRNAVTIQPLHVNGRAPPPPPPIPNTAAELAAAAPVPLEIVNAGAHGVPWPPGIAGRIAHFVYQSAPRPVKEVAIVSALGLLAGICGKAWHVPQSGLNMYIVLIARSAVGKEAMHSGISAIVKAVTEKIPIFHNFVSFDDFASGPALTKACATNTSFLNVSGEWGHKLKRMARSAEDGRDQAMTTLRQQMTNLYQKSGPQAIVGGIRYSQADNNVASVSGVAYSMIGETTPSTFYEALTESMMEDGFLSRFLNIEYNGERPPANPNQVLVPDTGLVELLSALALAAQRSSISSQPSIPVQRDDEAQKILASFEIECDKEINSTQNESYRQMWNRAALKSLRVGALLAVADNYLHPIINATHIQWAINLVRRDIGIMTRRIETGDVGITDTTRERKLHSIIRKYFEGETPKTHPEAAKLREQGIVTRKYLQIYCSQSSAFNKARNGATPALNTAIQSLVDSGFLVELDKAKVIKEFAFHGKCYRVVNLGDQPQGEK
jgi:hypothetical protein